MPRLRKKHRISTTTFCYLVKDKKISEITKTKGKTHYTQMLFQNVKILQPLFVLKEILRFKLTNI